MTGTEGETFVRTPEGYIRGGTAAPVEARRVVGTCLGLGLAGLVALSVALTWGAAHQSGRAQRLQRHGVAVRVTVTNCLGTATGTGITANGFACHGDFTLGGRRYNDLIRNSSELLPRGAEVEGVTDPASPRTLSVASAVTIGESPWRPYLAPAVSAVALVLAVMFVGVRSRCRGRRWAADATLRVVSERTERIPSG
jgi:hypothetical protein